MRDVVTIDLDGASVGGDKAAYHIEACRLAGAIGPEQAHHFATLERQADRTHDRTLPEAFADTRYHQALTAFDHARELRAAWLGIVFFGVCGHGQELCLFVFKET